MLCFPLSSTCGSWKLREMLLWSARLQRPPHAPRVRWRQPERCRAKVHLSAFDERRAASSWGSIDRQLDCTEATVRLATVAPVNAGSPHCTLHLPSGHLEK